MSAASKDARPRKQFLYREDFLEFFNFEENDRDKKSLKKEFKDIVKNIGDLNESEISKSSVKDAKIKFKHLVDYYLSDGSEFGKILRTIDSDKIFSSLLSDENQSTNRQSLIDEAESSDGFNEKLLKVMCLNQAIGKLNSEM